MKVVIFHQHDPGASHVGGIQTFLNTFIKYAPAHFSIELVGLTTDPKQRPVGRWQEIRLGEKVFRFLPVIAAQPNLRGLMPITVRMVAGVRRHWSRIDVRNAVLEIHRVEPAIALAGGKGAPKVLFLHAHSEDLRNRKTEVLWGKMPAAYQSLESVLIGGMSHVYIVREDAVEFYRKRYPRLADRISFLPTWVDEEVFASLPEPQRSGIRADLAGRYRFDPAGRLLLFVGRFEGQKDPMRLLESFRGLDGVLPGASLVMIGEGKMEGQIRRFIRGNRLEEKIRLIGPQPQAELARWMNAADSLVLSSAYEGMPRVVVEALRCGLPVVSTDVGEVRRLIGPGGGRLVTQAGAGPFSEGIVDLLKGPPSRQACRDQAAPFTAQRILEQVYSLYEKIAA